MSKIITTVGVYPNGQYKTNGVKQEHLIEHIEFNKLWRFGRALIVDGQIEYLGSFEEKELKKIIKTKELDQIRINNCTIPYQ